MAQGIPGQLEGTNTIMFINKEDITTEHWQDVTYGRVVVSYRPEKKDPNRIILTVGVYILHYPGDCGTPTVSILTVKMLLNSLISTTGSRYMTLDIKDFYLNTPMKRTD